MLITCGRLEDEEMIDWSLYIRIVLGLFWLYQAREQWHQKPVFIHQLQAFGKRARINAYGKFLEAQIIPRQTIIEYLMVILFAYLGCSLILGFFVVVTALIVVTLSLNCVIISMFPANDILILLIHLGFLVLPGTSLFAFYSF